MHFVQVNTIKSSYQLSIEENKFKVLRHSHVYLRYTSAHSSSADPMILSPFIQILFFPRDMKYFSYA